MFVLKSCTLIVLSVGALMSLEGLSFGQTNLILTNGLSSSVELVFMSGGDFSMGCPENPPEPWGATEWETPAHKVFVSPFWIGKYPITVRQFFEFLKQSKHEPSPADSLKFYEHVDEVSEEEYPINGVSFEDAEAYCAWLSKITGRECRLPTEAEWEFAAKGGNQQRTYPWGEDLKETRPNPWGEPIGKYPELATPEGVFDLNGPVYQWCQDVFNEDFYKSSTYRDPLCDEGTGNRVVRGGHMMRFLGRLLLPPTWKRFEASSGDGVNNGLRIVVASKE